jgi:hypothetical protein
VFGYLLLCSGALILILWGVAHVAATRGVVGLFGLLTDENRRILTMEWVAEGLALLFIGAIVLLVAFVAGPSDPTARLVIRASAVMALVMAGWTFVAGHRTSILPIRICPLILAGAAL